MLCQRNLWTAGERLRLVSVGGASVWRRACGRNRRDSKGSCERRDLMINTLTQLAELASLSTGWAPCRSSPLRDSRSRSERRHCCREFLLPMQYCAVQPTGAAWAFRPSFYSVQYVCLPSDH